MKESEYTVQHIARVQERIAQFVNAVAARVDMGMNWTEILIDGVLEEAGVDDTLIDYAGFMNRADFIRAMLDRAKVHDASKLEEPERSLFDKYSPMLSATTYGSPEYYAMQQELMPAIKHHWEHNTHHPEFHKSIHNMPFLDVCEMFCDWKAATERHSDGSLQKSIIHNAKRFDYNEKWTRLLENTRLILGW